MYNKSEISEIDPVPLVVPCAAFAAKTFPLEANPSSRFGLAVSRRQCVLRRRNIQITAEEGYERKFYANANNHKGASALRK